MPGGGIARLLAGSPTFGPTILAGVTAANGGELSAAAYRQFLTVAQTLADSGDPINHARFLAESGSAAVHLIEVVGEPGVSLPDQVVPNAVEGAPLSGTEPLAAGLGLDPIDASGSGSALVRFSRGTHGSIISPAPGPRPDGAEAGAEDAATGLAVTTEMQTQTATFAASAGQSLPIADAAVIAPLDVAIEPATLLLPPPVSDVPVDEGSRP